MLQSHLALLFFSKCRCMFADAISVVVPRRGQARRIVGPPSRKQRPRTAPRDPESARGRISRRRSHRVHPSRVNARLVISPARPVAIRRSIIESLARQRARTRHQQTGRAVPSWRDVTLGCDATSEGRDPPLFERDLLSFPPHSR